MTSLDIGYVLLALAQPEANREGELSTVFYDELKDMLFEEWPMELQGVVNEITALRLGEVDMANAVEVSIDSTWDQFTWDQFDLCVRGGF